jgi:ribonucleotide reductase alpha subunit
MSISRGKYICQSQSLNIHLSDPNFSKISSMHFYSWKGGLKTGMYYLRSRPAVDAIKFTLNVEELLKATDGNNQDEILKVINKMEHADDIDLSKKTSSNDLKADVSIEKKLSYNKIEDEGCINCSG